MCGMVWEGVRWEGERERERAGVEVKLYSEWNEWYENIMLMLYLLIEYIQVCIK